MVQTPSSTPQPYLSTTTSTIKLWKGCYLYSSYPSHQQPFSPTQPPTGPHPQPPPQTSPVAPVRAFVAINKPLRGARRVSCGGHKVRPGLKISSGRPAAAISSPSTSALPLLFLPSPGAGGSPPAAAATAGLALGADTAVTRYSSSSSSSSTAGNI